MSVPLLFLLKAFLTHLEQCQWNPPLSQADTEDLIEFIINCAEYPLFELTFLFKEKLNPNRPNPDISRPRNKRPFGFQGWHCGQEGSEGSLTLIYYGFTPLDALKRIIEMARTKSGKCN